MGVLLATAPLPDTLHKAVPSLVRLLGALHAAAPLPDKLCKAGP